MKKALVTAFCLVSFVATLPSPHPAVARQEPEPSTVRIAWDGPSYGLDPTSEYHYGTWEVFSSLTSRTLVTYRHISGPEGNELVPDLAVAVPQPTDGGLTYTFELKPGIMFGPPLNRAVTSRDFAYSFERMVCAGCYGAYDFYFRGTIRGMRRGEDHISGIETPDPKTIVFHLKRATGDFVHRLALPATGPIPQEVAGCRRTGTYGRRLVATGPYMLEGSETATLDENCRSVEPFGGYNAEDGSLHLVRNPNYDPATDSLDIRNPRFDQFFFEKLGPTEAFRQIENNEKDGALLEPSPRRIERYLNDGDDGPMLHSHAADTVWYVTMNLTQRPFDDVHVRRAFNLALDKAAVQDAWGDITGSIATHALPPTLTGGHPTADEYDPYATAGHAGDIERAREEMSRSRYDRDGDGRCDVAACESVRLVNRDTEPWISAEPFVLDALRSIGIEADVRRARWVNAYTMISDLSRGIPLGMNPGWGKDYADSGTYFRFLMHSSSFKHCPYTVNYSVIGGSEMKKRCNGTGNFEDLPNIDPDIEACEAIADEVERDSCWVDLDALVMEDIVPWVPLIWRNNVRVTGPGIGDYEFDQSTGEMSLAHIGP